jgi:hypothetical protein
MINNIIYSVYLNAGLSDPYVVLTLNGTSVRSKTSPKTLNPGTLPTALPDNRPCPVGSRPRWT